MGHSKINIDSSRSLLQEKLRWLEGHGNVHDQRTPRGVDICALGRNTYPVYLTAYITNYIEYRIIFVDKQAPDYGWVSVTLQNSLAVCQLLSLFEVCSKQLLDLTGDCVYASASGDDALKTSTILHMSRSPILTNYLNLATRAWIAIVFPPRNPLVDYF